MYVISRNMPHVFATEFFSMNKDLKVERKKDDDDTHDINIIL